MLGGIGLFRGIMAKMDWLDQNQRIISQNVANADTPGYRPLVLKDRDFKSLMDVSKGHTHNTLQMTPVSMQATNPHHFGEIPGAKAPGKAEQEKDLYESSPDNNGVVLEEQLFKANENSMNYQIATDLYRRNVGMLRMALGNNR